ncbi:hypothetical protein ACLM5J_14765 [Nocardioides sp. Bht2]|uniref:hypothetical protein n=1 Tax=Nocardioides sp. Bht2 TaxID=3392297 RepID=UPI0039B69BB4
MRLVPSHRRRLTAVTAVALCGLLALGACSGNDDKGESGKEKSTPTAQPSVDPGKVSPTDLPDVPELAKPEGAVADVSFGPCVAEPGRQEVAATVTNSAKKARDYVVTVSWINATSDVLARDVAVVKALAAGAEKKVTLSAEVPKQADQCTFHVQRGALR